MAPKTKTNLANCLMVAGLLPYLAVLSYVAWSSRYYGDAALAAAFTIILGLAISYVVALAVAYPAALWSRSLAKQLGYDTRYAKLLRGAAICGVFPVLAIFPVIVVAVFR